MAQADDRPFLVELGARSRSRRSAPRAGFASWYEIFPRSMSDDPNAARHLPRRYPPPAAHPRHGLRRALFPADPPDRAHSARAATTRSRRRRTIPAALRDRLRGGRARGDPSRARHAGGFPAPAPGSGAEHGIEIALDFAIQCSPDHPWLKQHPEWFDWRPDGTHPLRREPAEEIPGHRQRRLLRQGRDPGPVGRAVRRRAVLGRAGRAAVPRRQPAHQAASRSGNG